MADQPSVGRVAARKKSGLGVLVHVAQTTSADIQAYGDAFYEDGVLLDVEPPHVVRPAL
jgi:hypothetical protein